MRRWRKDSGTEERDGLLWVEGLPLGAGTNMLTLTMTDAAGNMSATNLSVVQSTVQLVLDDLTSVDLNQPRITVSGTINVSDHRIWVNGMEVTNVIGWDWWVEGVPVNPGGTAVIQAVAIPTTDNGGNGTGGNGGSGATLQNPGNPTSPNAKTVEGALDKQHEVVMTQYYKDWTFAAAELDEFPVTHHETLKAKWKLAQPGYGFWDVCWGAPYEDVMDYEWWHGIWDEFQLGVQWSGQAAGSESEVCGVRDYHSDEYPYAAPTLWPGESCHGWAPRMVVHSFRASLQTVSREAQTLYELHTGGKRAVNGRKNLFVLSAGAEGHADLFYPEIAAYSVSKPITSTAIALGALGKLGSDGRLYKALGDGETHDVTPKVAGSRYYTFSQPGMWKHKVNIVANNVWLTTDRTVSGATNFWIGELMNFSTVEVPQVDYQEKVSTWTLPQKFVNKALIHGNPDNTCVNYVVEPNLLLENETSAWWVRGGEKLIGCNVRYTFSNGQKVVLPVRGKLSMRQPAFISKNLCEDLAYPSVTYPTPCVYVSNYSGLMALGKRAGSDTGGYARFWASYLLSPGDQLMYSQIVRGYRATDGVPTTDTGAAWWLDGAKERPGKVGIISQAGDNGVAGIQQFDRPNVLLAGSHTQVSDCFKTYIQYKSVQPDSIPITLSRVEWSWGFDAVITSGLWDWIPTNLSNPAWHEDDSFPLWDGVIDQSF